MAQHAHVPFILGLFQMGWVGAGSSPGSLAGIAHNVRLGMGRAISHLGMGSIVGGIRLGEKGAYHVRSNCPPVHPVCPESLSRHSHCPTQKHVTGLACSCHIVCSVCWLKTHAADRGRMEIVEGSRS